MDKLERPAHRNNSGHAGSNNPAKQPNHCCEGI
jgi:hypothetical protein